MDELDLRTLWQQQPLDDAPPSKREGQAAIDFAVPTSQFLHAPVRRWPVAFLALAAVCVLGVMVAAALKFAMPAPGSPRPPPPSAAADDADQLEALLAECRTYSDPSGPHDWLRARAACQRALDLEPVNRETNALLERIAVLETCEQDYEGARASFAAGRLEAGLERLANVGKPCELYLLRALSLAQEPAAEVKRQAAADCKAYGTIGKWDLALPRCELYSRLACQTWSLAELQPPPQMKLKIQGPLNPKTDWRPRDEVYVRFLQARSRVAPDAEPWVCPELAALRPPPSPPDPSAEAVEDLSRRYPEPELNRALVLYFRGDFHSAPLPLQKVREQLSNAQSHQAAGELLLDLNYAINLYENGMAQLANDRPERAEAPFLKALELDERLVLGTRSSDLSPVEKKRELDGRTSFLRRSIVESMANQTYEKGKGLADRKDFRAACRLWKLGLSFSRANIDLLKAATNVCTPRAWDAVENAETCGQLVAGLDFAVNGDGSEEKLEELLASRNCP